MRRKKIQCRTPRAANATRVCIVDPQFADYQAWGEEASAAGTEVIHAASAADALRFARTQAVGLWVVNCDLPGLAGSELCSMLKTQFHATAVCLVAEEYSPEREQAAHAARATLFTCKPGHRELLSAWLRNRSPSQPPGREPTTTRAAQPT